MPIKYKCFITLLLSYLYRFNRIQHRIKPRQIDAKIFDNPVIQTEIAEKLETRLCESANSLTGVESQWKVIKSALTDIQENETGILRSNENQTWMTDDILRLMEVRKK